MRPAPGFGEGRGRAGEDTVTMCASGRFTAAITDPDLAPLKPAGWRRLAARLLLTFSSLWQPALPHTSSFQRWNKEARQPPASPAAVVWCCTTFGDVHCAYCPPMPPPTCSSQWDWAAHPTPPPSVPLLSATVLPASGATLSSSPTPTSPRPAVSLHMWCGFCLLHSSLFVSNHW